MRSSIGTEAIGIVRTELALFPVRALTVNVSIVSCFETLPL
jgi:hypothetical protein